MRRTIVLLFLLPLLAACGEDTDDDEGGTGSPSPTATEEADSGGGTLEGAQFEPRIAAQVQAETGDPVEVDCQDLEDPQPRMILTCDVRARDSTRSVANVEIQSVDPDADPPVQTEFLVPVLPTARIEELMEGSDLARQVEAFEAECPTLNAIPESREIDIVCEGVTRSGDSGRIRVTGRAGDLGSLVFEGLRADEQP